MERTYSEPVFTKEEQRETRPKSAALGFDPRARAPEGHVPQKGMCPGRACAPEGHVPRKGKPPATPLPCLWQRKVSPVEVIYKKESLFWKDELPLTQSPSSLYLLLSCLCPCEGRGKRHRAKGAPESLLYFSLE